MKSYSEALELFTFLSSLFVLYFSISFLFSSLHYTLPHSILRTSDYLPQSFMTPAQVVGAAYLSSWSPSPRLLFRSATRRPKPFHRTKDTFPRFLTSLPLLPICLPTLRRELLVTAGKAQFHFTPTLHILHVDIGRCLVE